MPEGPEVSTPGSHTIFASRKLLGSAEKRKQEMKSHDRNVEEILSPLVLITTLRRLDA